MSLKNKKQSELIFKEIEDDLYKLLAHCPSYGSINLSLYFQKGILVRQECGIQVSNLKISNASQATDLVDKKGVIK